MVEAAADERADNQRHTANRSDAILHRRHVRGIAVALALIGVAVILYGITVVRLSAG